jgi:predicted alpha/beta-fold hydrolase
MRRRSSVTDALPETPAGWTVLVTAVLSGILGYEVQLQNSLTTPPVTFGQIPAGDVMERIYQRLTESPNSILSRSIAPSLFVGTRGMVSSSAAYLMGGPSSTERHLRFREVLTMTQDGATIAVDWEAPKRSNDDNSNSDAQLKHTILHGTILHPVVIILHGINNDASFGYMRSLQRTFCDRGWNAASMNFRGTAVPMTTPRGYNGAYTGDLRSLVNQMAGRMAPNVPLFLVGNSLGANILTKYLGEEGLANTLPPCVAGGVSLGNPLIINSSLVKFPFDILMGLGIKKIYLENLKSIMAIQDDHSRHSLRKGFLAGTIARFDDATAPMFIRNDAFYPFGVKIGYMDGEQYWFDASSYRHVAHISVPFLNLTAQDDFLVSKPSRNKLGYCIGNPNVMVVETRCGGHLGWQESPPDGSMGSSSWADVAAADFFDAIMAANAESFGKDDQRTTADGPIDIVVPPEAICEGLVGVPDHLERELQQTKNDALRFSQTIQSRL